jgi:hypothetical protein
VYDFYQETLLRSDVGPTRGQGTPRLFCTGGLVPSPAIQGTNGSRSCVTHMSYLGAAVPYTALFTKYTLTAAVTRE